MTSLEVIFYGDGKNYEHRWREGRRGAAKCQPTLSLREFYEADTGEFCVGLYNACTNGRSSPHKTTWVLKMESARRLRDARPIGTTIHAVDVPTHATCRHRGKIAVCLKLEWSFGP